MGKNSEGCLGNDITERDGSEHNTITHTEKNVRVCALGQMHCLHFPSRAGQLPLSGRESHKKDNFKSTTLASQLLKSATQKKLRRRSVR